MYKRQLLPWLDLVLIDLKVMDPSLHQQMTGHDNEHIHANLRALVARKVPVEVRLPVVPGYNTSADNITATAAFLHDLGLSKITLLPYNPLWEAKLPHLHTTRVPLQIPAPSESFYVALQHAFASEDVQASRGPVGSVSYTHLTLPTSDLV